MQNVATPLYMDWSFWAVVIAFAALVLSQVPPIHVMLKRAKIDLELYSKISITHKLGNPNLQLHLILNNIGGRRVRVKDIKVSISKDGTHLVNLPAQNYLQNQNDQNTVLFTTFALDPKDEWAHITNFLNFFSRDDEKAYQKIEGDLLTDFRSHQKEMKGEGNQEEFYEHPNELVQPAFNFFEKHFCWNAGEYNMSVIVTTDSKSADVVKNYRFTIFESHTETLSAIKEHFKYGGGLYWNPKIQTSVILEVTEA
ncbi:hypothetical protein [Methylomonas rivi]|uniref:Uncharacterized protein n=1 Tax=Methylomonas rivi TaxID=2952226 RepID=A0ABT1U6K0_9GAMM|nr:hypothetical protein [Methylomonas sp. WSC-6]MCQ8129034.1 hypothetical protein [Methylomonas sp. WSC-6]